MTKQNGNAKAAQDNRANQLNPTHPAYHRGRGLSEAAAAEAARIGAESDGPDAGETGTNGSTGGPANRR